MDLHKTLVELQDMTKRSMEPHKVHLPNRTRTQYVINGEVRAFEHEPPAIQYQACDIDTLAVHCGDNSAVWHRENRVVAVIDATSPFRDDRVQLDLLESEKWQSLLKESGKLRPHADFVRFLVRSLRDELETSAPGLLGTLRALKFQTTDAGDANVQHGKESMGRSIAREISGATDLPETVKIKLRRWAKLDIFVVVECLLVLDTEERRLALQPLADATEQAEHDAQRQLHELLAAAVECGVNYGSPN